MPLSTKQVFLLDEAIARARECQDRMEELRPKLAALNAEYETAELESSRAVQEAKKLVLEFIGRVPGN